MSFPVPSTERIQQEIAVALSIVEQYGTNQPGRTYEHGVTDALLWVLGGPEPQSIEDEQMELNSKERKRLRDWVAGRIQAEKVSHIPLIDGEYENERLLLVAGQSSELATMVRDRLATMDEHGDRHHAIWLGSFTEDRPRTQVQLVITQDPTLFIDED
ncbi:hypothetical protein [Alkalimonas mucilaginosa]|uniref:Uncharacterized protein n=1 Tax=Alkalimonas mucilaginosa TaxID=3057676 RepID=A0ABU7JI11_9GAMM|nr:hypothetical protein [Alkalimonas sp. MEB004]MEE2025056.1 hypothetical protein [Alkalimonas sp. MEB004]